MIKKITAAALAQLTKEAADSPRKRRNHNFHETAEDRMHRMLNALEPGSYVRPHKHENPDKREAFIILRGKILVVIFDEAGDVTDHFELHAPSGRHGVEIPPRTYHTLISLENGSAIYEVKDGPWDPSNDKNFAPWAPAEGSADAHKFIEQTLEKVRLSMRAAHD